LMVTRPTLLIWAKSLGDKARRFLRAFIKFLHCNRASDAIAHPTQSGESRNRLIRNRLVSILYVICQPEDRNRRGDSPTRRCLPGSWGGRAGRNPVAFRDQPGAISGLRLPPERRRMRPRILSGSFRKPILSQLAVAPSAERAGRFNYRTWWKFLVLS
jgi:hypothetical protein